MATPAMDTLVRSMKPTALRTKSQNTSIHRTERAPGKFLPLLISDTIGYRILVSPYEKMHEAHPFNMHWPVIAGNAGHPVIGGHRNLIRQHSEPPAHPAHRTSAPGASQTPGARPQKSRLNGFRSPAGCPRAHHKPHLRAP